MKLTKWFWANGILMVILFILPPLITSNAPSYDGQQHYGFPFAYYSWGGLCPSPDGIGQVCKYFSLINLIVDISF